MFFIWSIASVLKLQGGQTNFVNRRMYFKGISQNLLFLLFLLENSQSVLFLDRKMQYF